MSIRNISNNEAEQFLKKTFSSPTHWPKWNVLVSKYYNTSFYYLGYFEQNMLTGILPIHESKYKSLLKARHSGQIHLIPNGGWIFNQPVRSNKKLFPVRKFSSIEIFSLPLLPEFNNDQLPQTAEKKTLIVDLELSLEEIWKNSIHSKRRNMIRKAEKAGIEITRLDGEKGLDEFYNLFRESALQYTSKPLPRAFFSELSQQTGNISLDIWAAYSRNNHLANVGIISDKNFSIYWLGNNAQKVKNMGQGEILQWHVIQEMKKKGCRYYDLCYVEPEKLPHIYKFKKGFSKNAVAVPYYQQKSLPFRFINKLL